MNMNDFRGAVGPDDLMRKSDAVKMSGTSDPRINRLRIYIALQLALLVFVMVLPQIQWHRVRVERTKLAAELKAFKADVDQRNAETRKLLAAAEAYRASGADSAARLNRKALAELQKRHLDYADYTVIHVPNTGCPAGWRAVDGLFTESDGSKLPGCVDWERVSSGDFRIDVLLGGESLEVMLLIPGLPSLPHEVGPRA